MTTVPHQSPPLAVTRLLAGSSCYAVPGPESPGACVWSPPPALRACLLHFSESAPKFSGADLLPCAVGLLLLDSSAIDPTIRPLADRLPPTPPDEQLPPRARCRLVDCLAGHPPPLRRLGGRH